MPSNMLRSWIKKMGDKLLAGGKPRLRRLRSIGSDARAAARVRLTLERLEDRVVPTAYTWTPTAAGTYDWTNPSNWSPNTGYPHLATDTATISAPTATQTIDLNGAQAISSLTIGSSSQITLAAGAAGALFLGGTLTNSAGGSDTISAPIVMTSNLTVNDAVALTISGSIDQSGGAYSLTKSGAGTLSLTGAGNFTGGVAVNTGGTLTAYPASLGSNAIVVNNGGQFETSGLGGYYTNAITLSGAGPSSGGALLGQFDKWAGPVTISPGSGGATIIGNSQGAQFGITGSITDSNLTDVLTLSGLYLAGTANSWGLTTISGGVTLETGATLGSGAVTDNSTLTVASSTPVTISNNIGGTGGVTQAGGGALTLSGSNSFAGSVTETGTQGLTILAGGSGNAFGTSTAAIALTATSTLGGIGTMTQSVTLSGNLIPSTTTTGTLTIAALALPTAIANTSPTNSTPAGSGIAGAESDYTTFLNGSACTLVHATGAIALGTSETTLNVVLGSTALTASTYTIMSGSSLTGTFSELPNGAVFSVGSQLFQINYTSTAATLTVVTSSFSTFLYVGGDLTNGSTRTNPFNGSTVTMTIGTNAFTSLSSANTAAVSGTPTVIVDYGSTSTDTDILITKQVNIAFVAGPNSSTVTLSSLSDSVYNVNDTISIASGVTLSLAGDSSTATSLVLWAPISGAGSLTYTGYASTSNLYLDGGNTYSGTTTVNVGAIIGGINTDVMSPNSVLNVASGAAVHLSRSQVVAGLTGAGTVDSGTTTTRCIVNESGNDTFSGTLTNDSGTVYLTKLGSGTLTLTGTFTYTQATSVYAGGLTLVFGNGTTSLGDATGPLVLGGATLTASGGTSGAGFTISSQSNASGYGTIIISDGNSSVGGATVNFGTADFESSFIGTLILQTTGNLSTNTYQVAGLDTFSLGTPTVTVNSGAQLDFNTIMGSGSVQTFGQSFTLNGTGVNTDGTHFAGALDAGYDGTLLVGPVTIGSAGASITSYSAAAKNLTIESAVTGGALTLGSGNDTETNTLYGANTNSGLTIQSSATVIVGTGSNPGTGAITNNNSLQFASALPLTVSGQITGTGTLIQDGPGTVTLSAANSSYSGVTTVNLGTLSVGADANLGADPGSATAGNIVLNGGTLLANSTFTLNSYRGIALSASYTANNASWSGDIATITTSVASNLVVGQTVTVSGMTPSGYDVTNAKITAATATTFSYILAGSSPGTYSSGGPVTVGSGEIDTAAGQELTYGGIIANYSSAVGALIVGSGANTGTLDLTGPNTYTGTTSLNAGTLLVDGSLSASSTLTAATGTTLGGVGTVNGTATVNGTLNPATVGTAGVFTAGTLTFGSGGTFGVDVVSGSSADKAVVSGTATLGGATLTVTTPAVLSNNGPTTILSANSVSGIFNYANGATVTGSNGQLFKITYTSSAVTLALIPVITASTASLANSASSITIAGTSFSTTAASDTVTFSNGVTGAVTAATSTSLTVSLTGLSSVTGGTALNATVTVDSVSSGSAVQVATVAPVVTTSTTNVTGSTTITINGAGFSTTAASDTVTFNQGVVGSVATATATQLTVTVTTPATGAGNLAATVTVNGTSSGAAVQVGTILPVVTLNSIAGPTNNNEPTFTGTAGTLTGDLSTITVNIYSGSSATGSPVETLTTTASGSSYSVAATTALSPDGVYTAQASQSDNSSGTGTSSTTTFTVDTTPPSSHASSPTYNNTDSFTVGYTSSDATSGVSEVQVYVSGPTDGGTYSLAHTFTGSGLTSGGFAYTATEGDGSYEFETKATDAVGNVETTHASADTTTIEDTVAPTSSASSPAYNNTNSFTVSYTSSDATSGVSEVQVYVSGPTDGGTYSLAHTFTGSGLTSGSFTCTATEGDGSYEFETKATDAAGNVETTHASADTTTIEDTIAPTSLASSPAYNNTNSFTVSYTSSDATSGVSEVQVYVSGPTDGGTYSLAHTFTGSGLTSGSFTYTATEGDGSYEFETQATDAAGNVETTHASADTTTVEDTVAPTVTLNSVTSPTSSTEPTFSGTAGTASGDLNTITVDVYSGSSATGSPVEVLTTTASAGSYSVAATAALSLGTYTAQASQSDAAGNTGTSTSSTFTVQSSITSTTTNLTDNGPSPSTTGQAVSYTVNTTGVPNGATIYLDDANQEDAQVGTVVITGGTGSTTISSLSVGTHEIFAVYGGDLTHASSQSGQVAQVVSNSVTTTTTSLTDNGPSPSVVGTAVSYTVSTTGVPNGSTVYLEDADHSNAVVGSVVVSGGTGSTTVSNLSIGSHSIFAVYTGAAGYTASQSTPALAQTVSPIAVTSVAVNGDFIAISDLSEAGQTVTVTTDGLNGFTGGNQVVIAGETGAAAGYNGTWTILSASGDTFTYTNSATGLPTLTFNANGYAISTNTSSSLRGSQRSMVDSVVYTFNAPVNLTSNAVTLALKGGITVTGPNTMATGVAKVNWTSLSGGKIWVMTFSSASGNTVTGHSIADGVYTLSLNSADVTAVAGGSTMTTTRATDTFYRLYADTNGQQRVSNADLLAFNNCYAQEAPSESYLAALDYNADGRVNNTDLLAFNNHYSAHWTGFTSTI